MLAAWKGPMTGTKFPLTKTLWDTMVRVDGSPKPRVRGALVPFMLLSKLCGPVYCGRESIQQTPAEALS